MADVAYISAFLNRNGVEGPRQVVGYIPARPGNFYGSPQQNPARYVAIGASGVTIATGCDLGQTTAVTLREYGLAPGIVDQFMPYLGLKASNAINKLAASPLRISASAAAATDLAVHAGYLNRYVRPSYERAAGISFDTLPVQAQAVIFSLCFQFGCTGVRRRAVKTWGFLVEQNWQAASRELQTGFPESYTLRRSIEGKLLGELT